MPEISILLPSIRPDLAQRCIEEFAATAAQVDYEIILVSPFDISLPRVVHIPELERRGVIHAMNEAYRIASANLVVLWSDDARPLPGSLEQMRRFMYQHPGPLLAGFRKRDTTGRESEQWSVYGKLYVGWLCAKKETIEMAGGLFDPAFRNYWADPDLSLRVYRIDGQVAVCPDAWIEIGQAVDEVKQANLSSSFERDTETFFAKWQDRMGARRQVWWRINTPIPYDLEGRVRGLLRQIPYLKETVDMLRSRLLISRK